MLVRILAALLGLIIVAATVLSAVRTFVLPRAAHDPITRIVFRGLRRVFDFRLRFARDYETRDRIMALYAPISLLALAPVWFALTTLGFTGLYWATGIPDLQTAFTISGSSLLTLGFARGDSLLHTVFAFTEAALGLILVAVLIAYLPTMYAAFSRREVQVNQLSVRAGSPPSPIEMLLRFYRLGQISRLSAFWSEWETWFVEVEESHTSLSALVFFRSPLPQDNWVNAAATVLDAAALRLSLLTLPDELRVSLIGTRQEVPVDANAAICLRSGFLALRHIAEYFSIPFNADPHWPDDPISITRSQFDQAVRMFQLQGLPLRDDLDKAWRDFAGWRVNYDSVLAALRRLTMAPRASWIYDGPSIGVTPRDLETPPADG
ncbi:MAG: hypothetical protein EPO32_04715 [Anaerolineae bacterium]|nr:MAG: hypothetical protein EPO32_04715 [Anaerolineae bacterium]